MKRFLIITLVFSACASFAQENKSPILFTEFLLGSTDRDVIVLGAGLNYQAGLHLFTAKYSRHAEFGEDYILPGFIIATPYLKTRRLINEWALLYGPRLNFEGFSASISAGVSQSFLQRRFEDFEGSEVLKYSNYVGVPYELNIKFFKKVKRRYRIYGFIPVGKPTGFGRSVGLKLFGNFSRQNYAGFGFSLGLGVHKIYSE